MSSMHIVESSFIKNCSEAIIVFITCNLAKRGGEHGNHIAHECNWLKDTLEQYKCHPPLSAIFEPHAIVTCLHTHDVAFEQYCISLFILTLGNHKTIFIVFSVTRLPERKKGISGEVKGDGCSLLDICHWYVYHVWNWCRGWKYWLR